MRLRKLLVLGASVLAVMVGTIATGTAASAAPPASDGVSVNAVQQYYIYVKTADIYAAGTDATVRMKVYGTVSTSPGYVQLDNPGIDDLEQGHFDRFGPFSWFDIGNVDFIGISKGSNGSEWYPEYAYITSSNAPTAFCPINYYFGDGAETQWFDCP